VSGRAAFIMPKEVGLSVTVVCRTVQGGHPLAQGQLAADDEWKYDPARRRQLQLTGRALDGLIDARPWNGISHPQQQRTLTATRTGCSGTCPQHGRTPKVNYLKNW
jgi:hypothetical protein